MVKEVREHLETVIIPFWKKLRDDEFGGYYGFMDSELNLERKAVKGCILNSRITWFFSNAYLLLKDAALLEEAQHAYEFMKKYCLDPENGGIYWSMSYDGKPVDATKHTYNQAFCIYALASYYDASKDGEALEAALELFRFIETKCRDKAGYLEAFDREFHLIPNDKLSENGVIADRTMNTLLHLLEAYTELYRVSHDSEVKEKLARILDIFADQVYNPQKHRLEVFFDKDMNSLLDLHSFGHDIEAAWLIDRGVEVLGGQEYNEKMSSITRDLTSEIYHHAFNGRALGIECKGDGAKDAFVWWVQAETVVGFLNGYQKDSSKKEYLEAAENTWEYIKSYIWDKREGGEWFSEADQDGRPSGKPIVEPWKCPYHNGRMCFEVIRRLGEVVS